MRVLTSISTLPDLQRYVDYLRTLNPERSDSAEYLLLKEFMRFSPEKFAREIGKNEVQFSKTVNNIKGELNKKIKHVVRIEKMNSILPSVGDHNFTYGRNLGAKPVKVQKTHCICIKDTIFGSFYHRAKFFRGVIYSYFIHGDKYYVINRDKPGDMKYGISESEYEEGHFKNHFTNLRDWRINQIIYSNSEFSGSAD